MAKGNRNKQRKNKKKHQKHPAGATPAASPAAPPRDPASPPESPQEAIKAAAEQLKLGYRLKALDIIDQSLQHHPEDPELLEMKGRLHIQGQEFDAAVTVHQRLVELQPDNPSRHNSLGVSLLMADRGQEAAQHLKRAAELDPRNPLYLTNLGKVLTMARRWEEAHRLLTEALNLAGTPVNPHTLEVLNHCRENLGLPPRRAEDFPVDLAAEPEPLWQVVADAGPPPDHTGTIPQPAADDTQGWENFGRPAAEQPAATPEPAQAAPPPEPAPASFGRPAKEGARASVIPPAASPSPAADSTTPPEVEVRRPAATGSRPGPAAGRPRPGRAPRPLDILFVQEAPCIRNYKMAAALGARGHRVTLAYTQARLSQMYPGLSDEVYHRCIQLTSHRQLWDLSREYDLVHCHNEPDVMTVAALAGQAPVIHDTHDLISLRHPEDPSLAFFEGTANRGAHGRVYTTPYQRDTAARLYGVEGPSLVIYNYCAAGDLPAELEPKLSAQDGQTHIVYQGGIGGNAHRDFRDLFLRLAAAGLHIHVYPTRLTPELQAMFSGQANIHLHQPVSPRDIIREMSRYDIGIIPFNLEKGNRRFLDTTIANKLFEYLAAGLPVMTTALASYQDYFAQNPVGRTFHTAEEAIALIPEMKRLAAEVDFSRQVYTYEDEVPRLEEFYYRILEERAPTGPGRGRRRQPEPHHQPPEAEPAAPAGPPPETAAPPPAPAPAPSPPLQSGAGPALARRVEEAVAALDRWLENNGWAGYDPYDVKSYILGRIVAGEMKPREVQQILQRDAADPAGLRRELGIRPAVNAKAMALLLGAYLVLQELLPGRDFSRQIRETSRWLLDNPTPGMSGLAWGYPFDWESVVMIPAGCPTGVISYHAGDAFWLHWQASGEAAWLERCRSVATFMAQDLNQDHLDPDTLCFSYTPLDFYHVHNASLCVAEFLVRVGRQVEEPQWVELGRKAVRFALRDLVPHGHLTYWARGFEPTPQNVDQIDHYHTAAELRSLLRLSRLLPDWEELVQATRRYLDFYLERFFEDGTIPKIHPQRTYPVDIHAAAEAAYVLGEAAAESEKAAAVLRRFLPWFLEQCANPDGSFLYQLTVVEGRTHKNRFPFLRWGQAWTMRGLASALAALSGRRLARAA